MDCGCITSSVTEKTRKRSIMSPSKMHVNKHSARLSVVSKTSRAI